MSAADGVLFPRYVPEKISNGIKGLGTLRLQCLSVFPDKPKSGLP
jgi:hypothetical protein